MSFSHACATNIVPLMARIVLGAAFIYAGYGKIFNDQTWTGEDAALLRQLGVEGSAPASVDSSSEESDQASDWTNGMELRLAGFNRLAVDQDQEQGDASDETEQEEGEPAQDPPIDESGDDPEIEQAPPPIAGNQAARPVQARKLYGIALLLNRSGIEQYEKPLAWGAALTELVGGALILIGLFSRIWGIGLAIVLAVAFYTTTWTDFSADPYGFLDTRFNHFFAQVGLFVLAFGVFLTGAGAISADRVLFRHGPDEDADVDLT